MLRLRSLFLVVGLALAGCAGVQAILPATPVSVDAGAAASRISAFRAQHGLGPVRLNPVLTQAARNQALAMASSNRMSHNLGGGGALPRRLTAVGYRWGAAAENIGAGYGSLDAALAGWQASAGHRKNLLLSNVTEIGIAAAHAPGSTYGHYWALILGSPPPERRGGWGVPM